MRVRHSLIALACSSALALEASAQEDREPAPAAAIQDAVTLPLGLAPSRHELRAVVNAFGGYDGAREAGVLDVQAAVRLFGRVSIHGGGIYVSSADEVRPSLGLAYQITTREWSPVDSAVTVTYRPEGLTEPEGEIETALAVSRRIGQGSVLASVTYGQDPEGNERDGELRAAGLGRVGPVLVGADGRARVAFSRPDGSVEPDYDVVAGPVVVYPIQSFALTGLVGASVVGTSQDTREAGLLGLMGLSRVF